MRFLRLVSTPELKENPANGSFLLKGRLQRLGSAMQRLAESLKLTEM
jgi:hypothetical protein